MGLANNSLQGGLQEAIRSALGCANAFEGDLHALCDFYGVSDGAVSGRVIPVAQKFDGTIGTSSSAMNWLLQNYASLPTLGFNFVSTAEMLDSRVTFARASGATRFNSSRNLVTLSNNQPRFDYNPATGAARGLLREGQRTNICLQSQDFTTTWTLGGSASITANAAVSPDGASNAARLNGSAGADYVQQTITYTSGSTYVHSCMVKSAGTGNVTLRGSPVAFGTEILVDFNLTTGVATTSGGSPSATGAQQLANGWWRCWFTAAATGSGSGAYQIRCNGGSVLLFGAQIEVGTFITSYIPTTSAQATRAADVASVASLGGWFNASEGALFIRGTIEGGAASTFPYFISLVGSNADTDVMGVNWNASSGALKGGITAGGTQTMDNTAGAGKSAGSSFSAVLGYRANNSTVAVDGSVAATDTTVTIPTVVALQLGGPARFQPDANIWIAAVGYYNARPSNTLMQSLTA